MRIILCTTKESAKRMMEKKNIAVSIEAEYGDEVIKGKILTLAHHVEEYKNSTAPCNTKLNSKINKDILISHIDLDTIGGIMEVWGLKPDCPKFWEDVEFIDVNGPHYIKFLSEENQNLLNAFYAFSNEIGKFDISKENDVYDATDYIAKFITFFIRLFSKQEIKFRNEYLEKGKIFSSTKTKEIESCLLDENSKVRIFSSNGIFCGGAYYSYKLKGIIPAIISFNEKYKSITLSFEDGGQKYNAVKIMQDIFGNEAGGRPGIAGTPRGKEFGMKDVEKVKGIICNM